MSTSSRRSVSPRGNMNSPGRTNESSPVKNDHGAIVSEFSESDVANAFKFLDLNRNNFLGMEEIRHVLICMGEMITEEEIDTMISMIDKDGDGQVSYTEFCNLMLDHLDTEQKDTADDACILDPDGNGKIIPTEVTVGFKNDIEQRESKRLLLHEFIREKGIGTAELKFYTHKIRQISSTPILSILRNGLDYSMLNLPHKDDKEDIRILNIRTLTLLPPGQYRKLFQLYAVTTKDELLPTDYYSIIEYVDMREFLLGAAHYLNNVEIDWRIKFVFDLYDNDRSGLLCRKELIEVLKANHMQSTQAVLKKAQTIMKQANNGDDKGTLNIDEFRSIASKFPNLLWGAQTQAQAQADNTSRIPARPSSMIGGGRNSMSPLRS